MSFNFLPTLSTPHDLLICKGTVSMGSCVQFIVFEKMLPKVSKPCTRPRSVLPCQITSLSQQSTRLSTHTHTHTREHTICHYHQLGVTARVIHVVQASCQMCVCVYVCVHVRVRVCVHLCVYLCVYVCVHVICTCLHNNTRLHTTKHFETVCEQQISVRRGMKASKQGQELSQ